MGLNVPKLCEFGLSPLEMSAFSSKRGFRALPGMLYPVSEATDQARIPSEPNVPNCHIPSRSKSAALFVVEIGRHSLTPKVCLSYSAVPRLNVALFRLRPR